MNRSTAGLFLGTLLVVLVACGSYPETAGEDTPTMQTSTQAEQPGRTDVSSLPDTMPLLPIMVQLERDMKSISSGLWRHDFEQIAASADNIANHPKIQPDQVKTIRSILEDTQFKTFVRDDKKFTTRRLSFGRPPGRRTSSGPPKPTKSWSRAASPVTSPTAEHHPRKPALEPALRPLRTAIPA